MATGPDQTYTVTKNPNWRVLEVKDNGQVVLISADSVNNMMSNWPYDFYLKGRLAYLNGSTYLNNACKEFSKGQYAIYQEGRSIRLDDINKINNYIPESFKARTYSIESDGYVYVDGISVGKTVFNFYDGSSWISLYDTEDKKVTISSEDSYTYTLNDETIAQKMLKYKEDGTTAATYWVANNAIMAANEGYVRYEIKNIFNGNLSTVPMFHSYENSDNDGTYGLRPIVTLKAGLTYTKDSNGIWQISQ